MQFTHWGLIYSNLISQGRKDKMKSEPKGKKDSGKKRREHLRKKENKRRKSEDEIILVLGKPVHISNL